MSLSNLKVRRIASGRTSLAATKWVAVTMVIISSVALPACTKVRGSEHPSHADEVANSSGSSQVHGDKVALQFKKGMAYADLRKLVVDAGWKPVIDPQCKVNVIGDNYADLCSAHPDLDDCRVCADMPELGACSSDGYCGMTFSGQTQKLKVTTYGMTDDRKVLGEKSRLQVVGWTIETKKP